MSAFNEERVLSVHHWTDRLFSFTATRNPGFRFISGQFTMIGIKINGKPDSIGVQTIAPDGSSFTDTNWNPGRENEKTTAVYVKQ